MTPFVVDVLQRLRADASPKHKCSAAYLHTELHGLAYHLRNLWIEARANRLYVLYDEAALRAEFENRLDERGFAVGFSFDVSDIDEDDEAYAATSQLAVEAWEAHPADSRVTEMLAVARADIEAWLTTAAPPPRLAAARRTTEAIGEPESATALQPWLF